MATEARYEYIHEDSINELLKCAICSNPFIYPLSTKCKPKKHTFCRHCIEEWLRHNPSCPSCWQQLHKQDLTAITDGPLHDMLDELQIKCLYCGQAQLERGNYDYHSDKVCSKLNTLCPSADIKCPWTGPRDQLDKHLNACTFNLSRPLITQLINGNEKLKEQLNEQNTQITAYKNEIQLLKDQVNRQQTQLEKVQKEVQSSKEQMKRPHGKCVHMKNKRLFAQNYPKFNKRNRNNCSSFCVPYTL